MSVLAADKLMLNPKLYSTFLLWLLSDIYTTMPEVGDQELPKLVFFFDEAHTLFTDTSPALVSKIEQVVRLIRSKGIGVYFITQNPSDIPDSVLGQLGNRVQHALRAYTPKDQKAVRAAAETFRVNPVFKTEDAIMALETGEALVSFLDAKGAPSIVERAKILFPLSQIGAITAGQRLDIQNASPLGGKYDHIIDRESAFEVLLADQQRAAEEQARQQEEIQKQKEEAEKIHYQEPKESTRASEKKAKPGKAKKTIAGTVAAAAATAAISTVSRSAGTAISNAVTGKKTKKTANSKSVGEKVIQNATSSAIRSLTRSILGSLIK